MPFVVGRRWVLWPSTTAVAWAEGLFGALVRVPLCKGSFKGSIRVLQGFRVLGFRGVEGFGKSAFGD